jgi:hypothetical protein
MSCKFTDCKKSAIFNFPGEKPMFCKLHRQEGMQDTYNKKCLHPGCNFLPSCNYPGG